MELTEVQKLIKKKIRKVCGVCKENVTREIIKDTWFTRKLRKELNTGCNILTRVKDKEGNRATKRKKIMNAITKFYKKLTANQQESCKKTENGLCGLFSQK